MDKAEQRRWMYRRWMYRLGLYVLISPFALYFVPNYILFGEFTRLKPADFIPLVESKCLPTVRAMKEFQRDTGHLPSSVTELVPKYLASEPDRPVRFQNNEVVFPFVDNSGNTIEYFITPGPTEGWEVSGEFVYGRIPLPRVTLGPAKSAAPTPQ